MKSKDVWPEEKIEREPNAEMYKKMNVDARTEESLSTKDQCSSFLQGSKRNDSSGV